MSLKAILFDLDGTLLPMNQDIFVKTYFGLLAKKLTPYGFESEKLISAIWTATKDMIKNTSGRLNEAVFWETFSQLLGQEVLTKKDLFEDYYVNEFQNVKNVCGFNPKSSQTIKALKEKGLTLILATNPLFPPIATESRMNWAGLHKNDFALYTHYENSTCCKPNPQYYKDILSQLKLDPKECLMVGNDVAEDGAAKKVGIDVFLITEDLINKEGIDINEFPNGNFDDLMEYISNKI